MFCHLSIAPLQLRTHTLFLSDLEVLDNMISYAVILAALVASALCQSSGSSSTMLTPSTQDLAGLPACAVSVAFLPWGVADSV